MVNVLVAILFSLLWRVRGGLGERWGHKVPANKIWFALFIGVLNAYFHLWLVADFVIGTVAAYTSYQLYGWGKYVGALVSGVLNKLERECELIDNLLDPLHITVKGHVYHLYDFPRLYGFIGTSLSMLIVTFIIGLAFGSIPFMLCGLAAGPLYYLGHIVCEYVIDDHKNGWNWGEWMFGLWMGVVTCLTLL